MKSRGRSSEIGTPATRRKGRIDATRPLHESNGGVVLAGEPERRLMGAQHTPPFEWPSWPFVLDIHDVAQILRTSEWSIRQQLKAGAFPILPMPRHGRTAPYRWSRVSVQRYVDGAAPGTPRRFFSKAKSRLKAVS